MLTNRPLLTATALALLSPAFDLTGTAFAQTAPPQTIAIPREKITLTCTDSYFKTQRQNFLLSDENYPSCTLSLPLALRQRWPGNRTFYVIPRVSASLHTTPADTSRSDKKNTAGRWLPLSPLVTPGTDPLYGLLNSSDYQAIELHGHLGNLAALAGPDRPDTVSASGKVTVCAAPVYRGEDGCKTFDVAARFKVYGR